MSVAPSVSIVANVIVSLAYLAIAGSILRPLLRGRAEGLNMLGLATAAIFLTCALHHGGHALAQAAAVHPHAGPVDVWLAGWDVVTMAVGLYYWTLRRGYGRLVPGGHLFADLEAQRASAREQAALRAVATAVAEDRPPESVFALVAEHLAELVGAECGLVARFEHGHAFVVGTHGDHGTRLEWRFPLHSGAAFGSVARTGAAARVEYARIADDAVAQTVLRQGYVRGIAAPVRVGEELWGAVLVATTRDDGLRAPGLDERLSSFGELVGLSVANAHARARLAEAAATDPLTGLYNHRVFQERLAAEFAGSRRHGHDLSLLVLDLDYFKLVNDMRGHQVGDRVLVEVAARLFGAARQDDTVARIGGEEFAVLMPRTTEREALRAAERMRAAISGEPIEGVGRVTASGGICAVARATSPAELMTLADGALYWAKANGRDVCFIYNPEVVEAISAEERADKLVRGRTLAGLRALAHAVDARDPSTFAHSNRVAEMAVQIAQALGWSQVDCARLREAGLVHDVGKIGVPDAVLLKPGRLTSEEYELIKGHVELGARIVAEVLDDEQVAWVRQHHERPDGRGYPAGVSGSALLEGSAILATADAWDAMTAPRPYRDALDPQIAIAEMERQRGAQFSPVVLDAFLEIVDVGGERSPAAARAVVSAAEGR